MLAIDSRKIPQFLAKLTELVEKGDSIAVAANKLGRGYCGRPISEPELRSFIDGLVRSGGASQAFAKWWMANSHGGAIAPSTEPEAPPAPAATPPPVAAFARPMTDREVEARIESAVQDATRSMRQELNDAKNARSSAETALHSATERAEAFEEKWRTELARAKGLAESVEVLTTELGSVRGLLAKKEVTLRGVESDLRAADDAKDALAARLRAATGPAGREERPAASRRGTWADAVEASAEADAARPVFPRAVLAAPVDDVTSALEVLVRSGKMTLQQAFALGAAGR